MKLRTVQLILTAVLVSIIAYFDYRIAESFLSPLISAAILVIFFYPIHKRIARKIRRRGLAALMSLAITMAAVVIPVAVVGAACIRQGRNLLRQIPSGEVGPKLQSLADRAAARLSISAPEVKSRLSDVARRAAEFLARRSAAAVGGFAQTLINTFVMVVALFYFFRDGPEIVAYLREIFPLGAEKGHRLFQEVSDMVTAALMSNIVTALAQGALAGLVFWNLRVPAPVFWAVVTGVFAFLPVIGPSMIWLGAAVVLFVQGEIWRGVAMLVLGNFGISGVDNFTRPALISSKSQLNGLVAFISVFGGVYVFGFLGLVLGPLLAAISIGILKGYREAVRQEAEAPGV